MYLNGLLGLVSEVWFVCLCCLLGFCVLEDVAFCFF